LRGKYLKTFPTVIETHRASGNRPSRTRRCR
jgi:hypothetical protein